MKCFICKQEADDDCWFSMSLAFGCAFLFLVLVVSAIFL